MQEGKLIFAGCQRRDLRVHILFIDVGKRFSSVFWLVMPLFVGLSRIFQLISRHFRCASAEPSRCLVPPDPMSERMNNLIPPVSERSGPRIFRAIPASSFGGGAGDGPSGVGCGTLRPRRWASRRGTLVADRRVGRLGDREAIYR